MQLRGDDRVSLWSRGVDRELFDPQRRDRRWRRAQGFGDDEVAVLFFGRLVLEKGVADFVATVLALRERGMRVRPLVVGEGPARDRFDVLGDAVFTGHLDGADLARAVASADILVHPEPDRGVRQCRAGGDGVRAGGRLRRGRERAVAGRTEPRHRHLSSRPVRDRVAGLCRNPGRRQALGILARQESARFDWDEASSSVLAAYRAVVAEKALARRPAPAWI